LSGFPATPSILSVLKLNRSLVVSAADLPAN
jgi:hypothetical protein